MKTIEPIQIWNNGQNKTASSLSAIIINDNLSTSCTFYWQLYEEQPLEQPLEQPEDPEITTEPSYISLTEGNVSMVGEDYQNWDDSNDSAYLFIAEKINVVIVS